MAPKLVCGSHMLLAALLVAPGVAAEVPKCDGCGDRANECWTTCGNQRGYCSACDSVGGTLGACCKHGDADDPLECKVAVDFQLKSFYHECVLVQAPGCIGCSGKPHECWTACGGEAGRGYCPACNSAQGTIGACCRDGDAQDPPECKRAIKFAHYGYHECVLLAPTTTITTTSTTTTLTTTTLTTTTTTTGLHLIVNRRFDSAHLVANTSNLVQTTSCTRWRISTVSDGAVTVEAHMGPLHGWLFLGHVGRGILIKRFGGPSFTWRKVDLGGNTFTMQSSVVDNSGKSYLAIDPSGTRAQLESSAEDERARWCIAVEQEQCGLTTTTAATTTTKTPGTVLCEDSGISYTIGQTVKWHDPWNQESGKVVCNHWKSPTIIGFCTTNNIWSNDYHECQEQPAQAERCGDNRLTFVRCKDLGPV